MKRKNLSKMARGEIRNLAGGGTPPPLKWILFETKELQEEHFAKG